MDGNEKDNKKVLVLLCFFWTLNLFFPKPSEVKQTDQQLLLRGEQYTSQFVMLPHDIVSWMFQHPQVFYPIFVGEPGRIEKYWQENDDLFEAVQLPDVVAWFIHPIFWKVVFRDMFNISGVS